MRVRADDQRLLTSVEPVLPMLALSCLPASVVGFVSNTSPLA